MPRFFKEFFEEEPFISGDDAKHIAKSLRMKVGEKLIVCDTKGVDYSCTIAGFDGDRVFLDINKKTPNATEPTVFVTLYQCLCKGDKMDTIVKQAVEMGVSRIVPVVSTNCVSRPDDKALKKKIDRWQKIANEASGQSGRGILPEVTNAISFSETVKSAAGDDICYFFYELGTEPMKKIEDSVKTVSVIIGPEGGFTQKEAEAVTNAGAVCATLGPRILRAETAPVAALANIMLLSGNMVKQLTAYSANS
ncbi:MAG: 16S rRNA (uracil(1498)-N(3))-methyltransferase [Acutalibacteraceae bacterium]